MLYTLSKRYVYNQSNPYVVKRCSSLPNKQNKKKRIRRIPKNKESQDEIAHPSTKHVP